MYFNSTDEEYFEKRINANIIRDKNEQKVKEIIVMVKKAIDKAIDKAREETEVVDFFRNFIKIFKDFLCFFQFFFQILPV